LHGIYCGGRILRGTIIEPHRPCDLTWIAYSISTPSRPSMARKVATPKHFEPEEESQEIEDEEVQGGGEGGEAGRGGISKVEAVRRALAAGHESPEAGTDFIRSRFGIEVGRQHFSSTKSQIRKKEREDGPAPKSEPTPRMRVAPVEGYVAPPPGLLSEGEPDLLAAMETMKPLIASLGADKVKRIVDLLG